jgi:hypothetical protein
MIVILAGLRAAGLASLAGIHFSALGRHQGEGQTFPYWIFEATTDMTPKKINTGFA